MIPSLTCCFDIFFGIGLVFESGGSCPSLLLFLRVLEFTFFSPLLSSVRSSLRLLPSDAPVRKTPSQMPAVMRDCEGLGAPKSSMHAHQLIFSVFVSCFGSCVALLRMSCFHLFQFSLFILRFFRGLPLDLSGTV